jgi:hypothetical protein
MTDAEFTQIAASVAGEQALLRCAISVLIAQIARQQDDPQDALRDFADDLHAAIDAYGFAAGFPWETTEVLRQSVRKGADAISALAAAQL